MKPLKQLFRLFIMSLMLFIAANCSGTPTLTIEIPPEVLQQKLNEQFPVSIQEQDASVPLDIVLSNPQLLLEEGNNKLGFHVTIDITIPADMMPEMPTDDGTQPAPPQDDTPPLPQPPGGGGQPAPPKPPSGKQLPPQQTVINGNLTVFSSLRYDASQKAIHISDPDVTELNFDMLPEPLVEPASQAIEQVLAEKFAAEPIYLPQDEALVQAATAVLQSIRVQDGKLLVEFGL